MFFFVSNSMMQKLPWTIRIVVPFLTKVNIYYAALLKLKKRPQVIIFPRKNQYLYGNFNYAFINFFFFVVYNVGNVFAQKNSIRIAYFVTFNDFNLNPFQRCSTLIIFPCRFIMYKYPWKYEEINSSRTFEFDSVKTWINRKCPLDHPP